jgi:HAD superfamily hydrolase (TIGR01490 family)
LALFDFDGTLTKRDSFVEFLKHSVAPRRLVVGLVALSPRLVAYGLGALTNHRLKEAILTHYFRGQSFSQLERTCEEFAARALPALLRPAAMERFDWHRAQRHRVVIVSASLELWLSPWASARGVEVIGSRLEVKDGRVTGRLEGESCHGEHKARRIRERLDLGSFERVYAYGDSRHDRAMLALADEPFYRLQRMR